MDCLVLRWLLNFKKKMRMKVMIGSHAPLNFRKHVKEPEVSLASQLQLVITVIRINLYHLFIPFVLREWQFCWVIFLIIFSYIKYFIHPLSSIPDEQVNLSPGLVEAAGLAQPHLQPHLLRGKNWSEREEVLHQHHDEDQCGDGDL